MDGLKLPKEFEERMRKMLCDECKAFFASYEREPYRALRVDARRVGEAMSGRDEKTQVDGRGDGCAEPVERFAAALGLTERVPWEPNGFYYDETAFAAGKHPYHEAGAYYIQEPSAMAPVGYLDVRPGERVLDLCAAPGGKSTQIAVVMNGRGVIFTNEYVRSRAKILSENIERMGVGNAIVTNETPERLAERFPGYFDKILVDAPCSGEGMMRKNAEALAQWSVENVKMCAERQDEILAHADRMLRYGGRMVYSTCTFAPEEDEGTIERFLEAHPEYHVGEVKRLWPHLVKGEGHFVAVLVKGEQETERADAVGGVMRAESRKAGMSGGKGGKVSSGKTASGGLSKRERELYRAFVEKHLVMEPEVCLQGVFLKFGDQLYVIPEGVPSLDGLKVERPGLHLGTFCKDRFEPAHALAHFLRMTDVVNYVNLAADAPETAEYLHRQVLRLPAGDFNGTGVIHMADPSAPWTLVCVDGISLGWGKVAGGVIKNHYPKGLVK